MPAKNKRRPAALDIQKNFAAHVEASRKAHAWAEKTLALRQAGKTSQANAAENKAKFRLRKMLVLEDQAGHGKPSSYLCAQTSCVQIRGLIPSGP